LDLVQLSYNPVDKVCTAKITDFGKYLYDKKKVVKEKKKTINK
jgi:translation initiation factor IF-3